MTTACKTYVNTRGTLGVASFKMVFKKFEPMHWFALDAVKFSRRGTHVPHVALPSK